MSLSATAISEYFVAIDQIQSNPQLIGPPVPTVQAIASRQQVTFSSFNSAVLNGCAFAKVVHLDPCGTVDDCSTLTSCEINGPESDSISTDLPHNICKTIDFSVNLAECSNYYTPAMARAEAITRHIARLETEVNKAVIALLPANAETVAAASFPSTTPSGGTVVVGDGPGGAIGDPGKYVNSSSAFTAADIGWLLAGADRECFQQTYILSGTMMQEEYWQAISQNPACCDPATSTLNSGMVDVVFDSRYLDPTLNNGVNNLFLVDPNMTVFWSANSYQNDVPQPLNDKFNSWVWRVASPRLTFNSGGMQVPVYFDVIRQVSCEIGGGPNGHYTKEQYRIIFNGGYHQLPDTNCSTASDCPGTSRGLIHLGSSNPPV